MITVHGPDGDLEYVNQRLLDYVGAKLSDLTDLGWARVLHAEDADAAVTEWLRALQYANKRAMDYVGKALSEVANLGWTDDVHPDDREAARTERQRCVAAGEAMDIEHRWRRHDGIYRWIRARVEPLHDERGRLVRWYGLLVDVDDWERAEEALRGARLSWPTSPT